jgi:hypothetical protein
MQIKLRSNKYQLIRYVSYSQEKKRPVTSVIGSIDQYASSIPDELAAKLEPDELLQLQKFMGDLKAEREASSAIYRVNTLADMLQKCQSDLEAGIKVPDADAVFEAMRALGRLMVKKGYKRPKVSKPASKDGSQLAS